MFAVVTDQHATIHESFDYGNLDSQCIQYNSTVLATMHEF